MISNFFLDNRIGGPHNYISSINKTISKKIQFQYISCGKSSISNIDITNLRVYSNILFPLEIILNFFEIILLAINKKVATKIFFVHSIYNIAPILAGCILKKKVYWLILETPNKFTKASFCFLKIIFNFKTIIISKKIKKKLNLNDDYIYLPPYINKKFWKKNKNKTNKNKRIEILCVGNINPIKGYYELLEYLKEIKFRINLRIVGKKLKSQRKYYNKLIEKILYYQKINENFKVFLEGYKSHEQLKKLYSNTDVFILSSLEEGTPLVVLEAMSMECFCIVSDCGNLKSIIKNNKNGFIFDHNKKNLMKKLLLFKSLTKIQKKKIQICGRKTINKNFSNKILYKKFYQNII